MDENGEPMVVYHGSRSNEKFYEFREYYEKGVFFSTSENVGKTYSNKADNLYSVFINSKNPLIIDNKGKDWNKIDAKDLVEAAEKMFGLSEDEFMNSLGEDKILTTDGIIAAISRLSEENNSPYDALILKNVIETDDNEIATDIVTIKSNQIKSATDNIGTFDPNNPDIRYQKGKLEHQSTNPVSKTTAYVAEMVGLKKAGIEVNVLAEDESYMMDEYDTSVLTPYLYGKLHSDIKYVLNSDEIIQQNPFVVLQTDKYDYLCQTDEDYNVKILNRYDKDGRLTNTNRPFVEEGNRGEISNNDSLNSPSEKGTHRGVNTNANRSTEDKRTSNGNTRIRGGLRDIGEVWVRPAESLPLKNPKGNRIYGWSIGGEIYLTPDGINSETPLHEYTHLWSIAMQRGNRAAWDSVVSLLKGTKAWKGVVKDKGYANLDTDDKIASEVLSRLSGAHGAKLIEQESEGKIEGDTDSARAQTILANIKKALETFWKWVGTDLFNIRSFSSVDEVKDRVLYDFVNGTDLGDVYSDNVEYQKEASESSEDYDLYRTVEDEDTIAFLEGQPSVTTYRSMVLIDGKLYPPMSSKESGSKQLRNPSELGKWEEAEEAPDKAYKKGNGWYFDLKKDNGKTVSGVAYNPYIHTSTTMLNDQFSEAQDRDNLVVVEMHVPESELTSGYKADKAKDSVGAKQWKAGIIQGMLSGTREVILTRWAKPVRIVPVEEVADHIAGLIEGKVEVMPTNVVTPQQREALEERGVKFVETDNKGKIRDDNKNTVIFHEVRKKSGRRMCRQLPLTSFSQCFLTKGKRLTGGV